MDDLERLRLATETGRPAPSGAARSSFVGRVLTASPQVGKFIAVRPTDILGDESEGSLPASSDSGSASVPVYLVGPGVPATGELLVVRSVPHRWVAERMIPSGGGDSYTVTIPRCTCTAVPAILYMDSLNETCNFGMFRDCTLIYQPVPSVYASLGLGANAFISVQDFPDPVAGGARFRYHLACQLNQFFLSRVYATSPYGSPYRDAVLYTWLIGAVGNTCTPTFALLNGLPFPGSDAACRVQITS